MSLMNDMIDNVKQLVKEKQYKEAIIQAENLFGYQIDDYNLFMFTANAYLQTENYEKCYEMLKKGIRMKPESRTGYAGILKLYTDKRIPGNSDIKKYIETLITLDSKNSLQIETHEKALKDLSIELRDFDALSQMIEKDSTLIEKLLKENFLNEMSKDFFTVCVKKALKSDEMDLTIENWLKIKKKIIEFNIVLDKENYDKLISKILDQEVKDKHNINLPLALDLISFIINEWYESGIINIKQLVNLEGYKVQSDTNDSKTMVSYMNTINLLKMFVNGDYLSNSNLASKFLIAAKTINATIFPFSAALISLFCLTHNHTVADDLIKKTFSIESEREQLLNKTFYLFYGALLECRWFLNNGDKILLLDDSSLSNKAMLFSRLFEIVSCSKENLNKVTNKVMELFSNNKPEIKCLFEYLTEKVELKDVLKVQSTDVISILVPILCNRSFDVPISELNEIVVSLKNLHGDNQNHPYLSFCIGMIIINKYPREAWGCFSLSFSKLFFNFTLTKAMVELSERLIIPKSQLINVMDSYHKYGPLDHKFIVKYCKILSSEKQFEKLKDCLNNYFRTFIDFKDTKNLISLEEHQQLKMLWAISFKELGFCKKALDIVDHVYKDTVNFSEEWIIIKLSCYLHENKFLESTKCFEEEKVAFTSSIKVYGLGLYSYLQLLMVTPPFSRQKILCLKGIYEILYNSSVSLENSYQLLVSSARHYFFLELALLNNKITKEISLPLFDNFKDNLQYSFINLAFNETLSILEACCRDEKNISIEHLREIVRCLLIKYNQERNKLYLEIALECLTYMEKAAGNSLLYEILISKSIVLLFDKQFEKSREVLKSLTEMNLKHLKPWLLLFVIEILCDEIDNENVVNLVKTCVTINNDDPMVPIMVVITALNNAHSSHNFECESWEYLFRQVVQSAMRGQSLTLIELFAFFRLIKPNQFTNNECDNEMDDFWYAFKSYMLKKYINYENSKEEEIGEFLRAFAAQELNDIDYAEEIFKNMAESDNQLIKTVKYFTLGIKKLQCGGTKIDALNEFKKAPLQNNLEEILDQLDVFDNISYTNIKELLKAIDENDVEMFKYFFKPKYVSLILSHIYGKKLEISKGIFEVMKNYPTNILIQSNPYDNLDVKGIISLEGGCIDKKSDLTTESESDKILLEKSLYLKLMYLKEQYEPEKTF